MNRQLHMLTARTVAGLKDPGRYADGGGAFGPSVYANIHYAVLETEQALEMHAGLYVVGHTGGRPVRGGRSSPVAKEFSAPHDWLARSLDYDWQDAGRHLGKQDTAVYLQILPAINEVITDDEYLPRGGEDLLAHARKATRGQKPKQ